ncbi:atpase : Uncharacterized protein OS=Chondromyces apiculatus DSM 436 GN=CAP_3565 PE=4 SV=1: AAA_21 [Gemmata massiliana]|uniref:AAA+ ATPase domain-containing protein n=1 Tax=Gemmata massiliana TaxID=1210884 RepID=A0A6P2CS79_9BACT|nr:ATP-binding protein [Gemmata massiliana]VTR90955.1 atpase : Uncharacterized protein OS=Chondromyces apiculatus DSM 436 GN=CAP_3565 PE=4 SV=1: AAA_21 [Gemmata massiliana]
MIHRAKFQNFKALRDVEITFDSRLTVLVGPNGSGKTSVLQGIGLLAQANRNPGAVNHVLQEIRHLISSGTNSSEFQIVVAALRKDGEEIRFEILPSDAAGAGARQPRTKRQLAFQIIRAGQNQPLPINQPQLELFKDAFGETVFLRLDAIALADSVQPELMPPNVQPNGSGLAATLGYLALNQPEQFAQIVSNFRSLIPNVEHIRFDEVKSGTGTNKVLLFDFSGGRGIRSNFASNGTLYLLGLLTVILGPRRPRVILFDDLDHGLHPKAQMELVGVLRKLLTQFPDLQIIATSHSPYILNQLAWNEVRVTGLSDDGSAICARLEDHPEVERWREAMTPGEFWSHIGDDWVKKLDKPQTEQPQPTPVAL